jgi:hypothetical protein
MAVAKGVQLFGNNSPRVHDLDIGERLAAASIDVRKTFAPCWRNTRIILGFLLSKKKQSAVVQDDVLMMKSLPC